MPPIDLVSDPNEEKPTVSPKEMSSGDLSDNGNNAESSSEMEQLRRDLDEAQDRMLRARAELENYRTRMNRQIADERKYASIDLIRDMLPVWDNISRALDAVDKTHNTDSLVEGVRLVYNQFVDVLQKHHCEKLETLQQPFDPNFHASIAQLPSADVPPGTIIEEVLPGFKLYDRVVRPSQVVLAGAVK